MGKKLVTRLISSIDGAGSEQELLEKTGQAFESFVQHANSIQSASVARALSQVGKTIHEKVSELGH